MLSAIKAAALSHDWFLQLYRLGSSVSSLNQIISKFFQLFFIFCLNKIYIRFYYLHFLIFIHWLCILKSSFFDLCEKRLECCRIYSNYTYFVFFICLIICWWTLFSKIAIKLFWIVGEIEVIGVLPCIIDLMCMMEVLGRTLQINLLSL